MIPETIASDDAPHPHAQNFPSGLAVQGMTEPYPFRTWEYPVIDPRLLSTTEAPPSTSDIPNEIWMGYPDVELWAPVSGPIIPGNMVSALARRGVVTFADRKSLRMVPMPRPRIDVSVAVTEAPAFPSANPTD